jgi:hypothetical protein
MISFGLPSLSKSETRLTSAEGSGELAKLTVSPLMNNSSTSRKNQ